MVRNPTITYYVKKEYQSYCDDSLLSFWTVFSNSSCLLRSSSSFSLIVAKTTEMQLWH